jgi:iron-sulfur cluster assembly protein|tara:strand:+ start:3984 stop:4292 length:309 start_codon:yes stop_codon:yes gene_type:complete
MIQFTEAAVNHLKTALDPGDVVRVGVLGGGCSGMSYSLSIETEFDEEDFLLEYEEVKIYVDPHSSFILNDTTVDYVITLQQQGFAFNNPNANTTCGCGSSFS